MPEPKTKMTAERLLAALDRDPDLKAEVVDQLSRENPRRLVLCQDWEESERGWGVRPDGFTLHLNRADWKAYVTEYNNAFNNQRTVPNEYTRVSGGPRLVEVSEEMYQKVASRRILPDDSADLNHPFQKLGIWGEGRTGPEGYTP
ncbi:hypothetical protein N9917_04850 [Deltaproteobacteria bacterium]|nr:hypothetical protein [Deltaproteobacteria bacterium]